MVELLGPAGAGKTTLLQTLRQRDPRAVTELRTPEIARIANLSRDVAPMLVPFLLRHRHDRWFSRLEMRSMAYLGAWRAAVLGLGRRTPPPLVLLDHGPIFRLALLREFGPALAGDPAFARWWERSLEAWARLLDVVVLLDAPDDVLQRRIDERARGHAVKGRPRDEVVEFVGRYRRAFADILGRCAGPVVLRFDTQSESARRIADAVLSALDASGARA